MEKILSIIIPTYNMQEYLARCVDSLVKSDKVDNLEIFIVNDGSKDRSLEIARGYESQYPNSVIVIDKPNGNYGSTINAALPRVSGKYVKILDADDWFDTVALNLFIEKLSASECDMIFTPYTRDYVEGKKEICNISGIQTDRCYDFETFMSELQTIGGIRMHMVAYKSEIVTTHNYKQTEGISYTDNEWIFYPLYYVNSIEYVDLNLYQHFIGRAEQTTNPKVRAKNYWHETAVTLNMLKSINNYESHAPQYSMMQKTLVRRIISNCDNSMMLSFNEANLTKLHELLKELDLHPNIKTISEIITIGRPIRIHVVRYCNKMKRNYPWYFIWQRSLIAFARQIIFNIKK